MIQGDLKKYRALVDTYDIIQDARKRGRSQLRAMELGVDEREAIRASLDPIFKDLEAKERYIAGLLLKELGKEPLWNEWLKDIIGVGPRLGGRLLSLCLDPDRNISSWFAYMGIVPVHWRGVCANGHKKLYPKDPTSCTVRVKGSQKKPPFTISTPEEARIPVFASYLAWVGFDGDAKSLSRKVKEIVGFGMDVIMERIRSGDTDFWKLLVRSFKRWEKANRKEIKKHQKEVWHVCSAPIVEKEFVEAPPRKAQGWFSFWETKGKYLYFLIGSSFYSEKAKGGYYYNYIHSAVKEERPRAKNEGHAIRRAFRRTVKFFLCHTYQALHDIYGIPARKPWVFEYGGHTTEIDWREVLEHDRFVLKTRKKEVQYE